jgi:hypothetical protein
MSDPFSDAADPYPPEEPAVAEPTLISRRTVNRALLMLPVLAHGLTGCVHVAPACPVRPGSESSCQHRFCRNYRA